MRALWLLPLLVVACTDAPPADPSPEEATCVEEPGHICTVVGLHDFLSRGFNGDGLPATETMLYFPTDLDFDGEGRLIVVDFNNQRIRRVEADGTVQTLAGTGMHAYATPGLPVLESAFENPVDIEVLPDGRMLLSELHAGRVLELAVDGFVQIYAGTGEVGYAGDDGPAFRAALSESYGITTDPDGILYIADTDNHCIRGVTPEPVPIEGHADARLIWNVAGHGDPGLVDGAGPDARFQRPHHLTWHDGALYVADMANHVVRRVDLASGAVETLAGTGQRGYSGDGGPAIEAQLTEPTGVAIRDDGTLYIADRGNHLIREISPDGTIHTLAGVYATDEHGMPEGGQAGDGGPANQAQLRGPQNVVLGPDGHLYVADTLNGSIRRIFLR